MSMILSGEALLDPSRSGGKGAALARLGTAFPVPPFIVLPAEAFDEQGIVPTALCDLEHALRCLGAGPFAVRSSGREEDGTEHRGMAEGTLAASEPAAPGTVDTPAKP